MRLKDFLVLATGIGAGMFIYGVLEESKRLVVERRKLKLKGWPKEKNGYVIVVLSDFHIRGKYSLAVAKEAVALALAEAPDMIVMPGDFIAYWKPDVLNLLAEALEPLRLMAGRVIAVPGNHEYVCGEAGRMDELFEMLNVRWLRNESWEFDGIRWVGIDSAGMHRARLDLIEAPKPGDPPGIVTWHEGDLVGLLPPGFVLQISGHSHGGQFRLPFKIAPMHSYLGKIFEEGFFPNAPTPLYVSRGIGTTGPPSRFNCPPEVSVLTLIADD